jgi:hypothetical protein
MLRPHFPRLLLLALLAGVSAEARAAGSGTSSVPTATTANAPTANVSSVPAGQSDAPPPAPALTEVQVTVVQAPESLDADEAKCRQLIEATFRHQGLDPAEPKIEQAITALCNSETRTVLLVSAKEPEPVVTFDLLGSYSDGNVQSGSLTFSAAVEAGKGNYWMDAAVTGALVLDSGVVYHSFAFITNQEWALSERWSLFGLVSVMRDTGKAIGIQTSEYAGAMFHVFGREADTPLKLSAAVGHRFEKPIDDLLANATNVDAFADNKAVLSYRVKYGDKFFNNALELVAALWFQHVLYGPPTEAAPAQVMDFHDFRLLAEAKLRFYFAEFGKPIGTIEGVARKRGRIAVEAGFTYDYYAVPLAGSPWDLLVQGGLSVAY